MKKSNQPHKGLLLSTTSVNVSEAQEAFKIASQLKFDGIELAILHEKESRTATTLRDYEQKYQIPIVGVHSPTMLLAYNIWGFNLYKKIEETIQFTKKFQHTEYVVIHPPFKFTKAAKTFNADIKHLKTKHPDLLLCVENMFPYGFRGHRKEVYGPSWLSSSTHVPDLLFDTSHAGLSGWNLPQMAETWAHKIKVIHLSDARTQTFTKGAPIVDEHLPIGRGDLPLQDFFSNLIENDWNGYTTLEINTHSQKTKQGKIETLKASQQAYLDLINQ